MSNNATLLFVSFWFSTFFLSLAVSNSLLDDKALGLIDNFLVVLLCILYSYEYSKRLTLRLTKSED